MTAPPPNRLLVPVADSVTVRNTVAYAVDEAERLAAETDDTVELHFVVVSATRAVAPDAQEELGAATDLVTRVEAWTDEDHSESAPSNITVETAVIGTDRYLFSPDNYATVIIEYADEHDIDRVILDPEYNPAGAAPMLQPLEFELEQSGLAIEEAPVERGARPTVLARAATLSKYGAVFLASYGFYMLLSAWKPLDFVTGAITALLVSGLLAPVAFSRQPSLRRLPFQLLRLLVYVPYLLWEIAKANLHIAYVVLHPSLPIEPTVVRYRAAVWGDAPVTTLANSITLTPGTLTVNVSDRAFDVHALTDSSKADLLAGGLERAVRFVFYGRDAAAIASPEERGDHEEMQYDG